MTALATILALGALPGSSPAEIPDPLSLSEALAIARARQPTLEQRRAAVDAARARSDRSEAVLWPQLSTSLGYQRTTANFAPRPGAVPGAFGNAAGSSSFDTFNYFTGALSMNQLLYDFGRSRARWRSAQALEEAEAALGRSEEISVGFEVRRAFFQVRAAQAMHGVAKNTLSNQERHLEQIGAFVEAGTRPEIDLAQVRMDKANAEVGLAQAQSDLSTALAELSFAMGVELPADLKLREEPQISVEGEASDLDGLVESAMHRRPDANAMEARITAHVHAQDSASGGYYPVFAASAALSIAATTVDDLAWNLSGGLTMSWPIFEGGASVAEGAEVRANLSMARSELVRFRQMLRLEIERAQAAVSASKMALDAGGEAVENARKRLLLAEGRYETGVGSIIELGDAELALVSALAQQVRAEQSLATMRAQLLMALGEP